MTAVDATDIAGHHLALVSCFRGGDPGSVVQAYERFLGAVGPHLAGGLAPEKLRQVGQVAEQFVRMMEIRMTERGQTGFAPELIAGVAGQARLAAQIGEAVGDPVLAAAGRRAAARFWQVPVPGGSGALRSFWRSDTPMQLQVEPTNHCNLKCTMCPRTTAMTRPLGHMDEGSWRRVLESWSGREIVYDFEEIGPGTRFSHKARGGVRAFFLGEFLMHPDFEAFIRIARELDADVGVQTNGLLLAKRSVRRRLLDIAPRGLAISLDGVDAATYEAVRAGGRWVSVKSGIEAFVAERDAAGLTDQIPLKLTTILPDDTVESREKARAFLSTIADGRLPIEFIELTSTNPAAFYTASGEVAAVDYAPLHAIVPNRPSCFEPLEKLQVLWDGRIAACCNDVDGVIDLGHVRDGIDAAWQGEPMRRLQRAHLEQSLGDFPLCQSCLNVDAQARPRVLERVT